MYLNIEKKFNLDLSKLKDPIVIVGWPGIALVAKLAITAIKDSIKADLFMEIECFDFPPKTTVEKGILTIPKAEVYYKSRSDNDFFILTAEYQPQTSEGVFEFSRIFCDEMSELTDRKIKMYVSAGALVSDSMSDNPFVHVCGTDKDVTQSFLKFERTKLMDGGVIAGANGILPAWAGLKGHAPGVCLLAETMPLPMMNIDPRASKALVSLLKSYFNIDMNFDELNKKITEMENIFESAKKQADHLMHGDQEDREDNDSYFR